MLLEITRDLQSSVPSNTLEVRQVSQNVELFLFLLLSVLVHDQEK